MTSPRPRRPFARGLALGTVALVAVAGACIAPDAREGGEQNNPTDVEAPDVEPRAPEVPSDRDRVEIVPDPDPGPQTSTLARQPTFTPFPVKPDIRNRREVQAALEAEYPPLLREAGIGGTALVWFFIDETGEVRNTEIRESAGHEALDHAALDVARTFEFTPAMNGDEPAPVWIALPITFTTE